MRKFYIFYPLFSVIFLSTIYFFTLIQGSLERSFMLFSELSTEAYESRDMTPLIKYQSVAYNHLDSAIFGDYQFESYQVIAYDDGVYKNQFVVYVLPLVEVDYAQTIDDEDDQTGLIIKHAYTADTILNTYEDDDYKDKALSLGIFDFGFYYHHIFIEEDITLDLSIYDYHGELIFEKVIDFEYIDYSPDSGQMELGYTQDELEDLMDVNTYIRSRLIRNITIFLVFAISLGGVIVFMSKRKKHKASLQSGNK